MKSKLIQFVTLAAVAIFSVYADYWDDAAVIVEELQLIVNSAQQLSFAQSGPLQTHHVRFAWNITAEGQAKVEEGAAKISQHLDSLQLLADSIGRPQCLEDRYAELQAISDDISFQIFDCIKWLEIRGTATIMNISAYIYGAQGQVTEYRIAMEQCPRSSGDEECILSIIGEMEVAKQALPSSILDETLRVILVMKTFEESILECVEHREGDIYTQGNRIVLEVEQCMTQPQDDPGLLQRDGNS